MEKKKVDDGVEKQLQSQVVLLDPSQKPHKDEKKSSPLGRRLNAKQKRQLKLFEIPKEEQKYVETNVKMDSLLCIYSLVCVVLDYKKN